MGKEVTLYIEYLGGLNQGGDLRRRQVRLLKLLRGTQSSDEGANEWVQKDTEKGMRQCAPVVSSNHHTAGTGLLTLIDLVNLVETLALVGSLELLSELIIADAASVDDRVGRKNVLCAL